MQSVKSGQGMAIYTAECSHTFHFPCIASHVKKQDNLVCPVCNSTWKDVPLLAIHRLQQQQDQEPQHVQEKEIIVDENINKQDSAPTTPRFQQPPLANVRTKNYSDDEPLLTPKCSAIPEANEEFEGGDDEEIEEFKGFFVNPISSDENGLAHGSRNVEVSLFPEAVLISIGQTHETYAVVLKIKAPPPPPSVSRNSLDPAQRAPIDLVTVLDVSLSMSGAKLQMLKRAMRLVISSLGSADRLSIVAFSAAPKRLMALRRMTAQGQRAARRIIDRLATSQGTCVGEALRKASKVLEDRRERNPVASIMLLSDGHDEGVQSTGTNQRQGSSQVSSTRFSHVEIPVQSSGFGGNSSYRQEPAEDAFTKCVGGLLCVVVQDLRIQLGFASGSDPAEVSAAYLCNGRPVVLNGSSLRLGNLYAEEEREVLLELRVPISAVGSHHVLAVQCCYKDPATQELVFGSEQALLVPRLQAIRSVSPRIERLRNLFITTRAIAESQRLVEHNELTRAMQLLTSGRALLLQSGQTSAEEYIKNLEAELSEVQWRRHYQQQMEEQRQQQQKQVIQRRRTNERESALYVDENGEPLTPTSAWRAAEKLAKVAHIKKAMNRVGDLHGFENARF